MSGVRPTAAALVLSLLAACTGLGGITQKPEIALSGIDLRHIGLSEQRFGLKLRVRNPNDAEIPIVGLTYEVEVSGQRLASGVSDKAVTVPRHGEAILELSAVGNAGVLLRQLSAALKSGRQFVPYRLSGRLNTGHFSEVPFDYKGEVAIRRLPDMGPRKPDGGETEGV